MAELVAKIDHSDEDVLLDRIVALERQVCRMLDTAPESLKAEAVALLTGFYGADDVGDVIERHSQD
jgi:hypothetical protein